jgi:putative transposase
MSKKRRQYSGEYKFKLALEATKEKKTLGELSSEAGVHPNQISQWKGRLLEAGPSLFERGGETTQRASEKREAELYEQIGRLKMELEWVKKRTARFGGGQTGDD